MNPFVFIVGCPRSGTSLLRRMADAHPHLAVAHDLTDDGGTPNLLERLRTDASRLSSAELVTERLDRYGDRQGKTLVGDQTPEYVRYLPTLHELWPRARFVHLVRDGRDVCLSVLDWRKDATDYCTFGRDPVTTIAVWWEWYVRLGLEGASELEPDVYHELRYESLVDDPEWECARLCKFLGLPFDDAILRVRIASRLRSWRSQLRRADVVRFEAAAGALLDELGYERATSSVPRSELARAARVRETFSSEVIARGRPLPSAWWTETVAAVP